MRKLTAIIAAALAMVACSKDMSEAIGCKLDIHVDWVRGSKAQFTITSSDKNACYVYGKINSTHPYFSLPDEDLVEFQLGWMEKEYQSRLAEGSIANFADLFAVKGTRTLRETQLADDMDWAFIVFQINPETHKPIGPLHKEYFHTLPIPKVDLSFTIEHSGDAMRIIPSNDRDTWFWEYESWQRMVGIYGSPYYFYYTLLDMYDQYGFLYSQLCHGEEEWVFSRDDRSIKEDEMYTMCISGCADGEITTEVFYLDFTIHEGVVLFENSYYQDVKIREGK